MITLLSHRRARAHLFNLPARSIAVACAVFVALAIGLGLATERAHSAPLNAPAPGFVWLSGPHT